MGEQGLIDRARGAIYGHFVGDAQAVKKSAAGRAPRPAPRA